MLKFWQKKIVDIYIIREVLIPFLVGVAIIGVIMLSSYLFQLTDLIIIKDIPVNLVLRLLFYQLPEIIVQTFPMAILFATMSGMGRLNRENEFSALRMGGISLYRLILPLILLGLIISGMTYFLNEEVVPWSNHEAQNIIRRSILKEAMPDVKEDVFFKGPKGRLFYVKQYDEKEETLEKIVIFNFPEKRNYPEVITAESGRVVKNNWQLEDGIIHQYSRDGRLTLESQFEVMDLELAEDVDNFFGEQRTTSEMSREELKREIDLFQNSGINVDSLLVDYHLKLAMPLSALIFILIGTPLSLSNKDSRSASIILTIVIIFSYYLIQSLSRSFGRNGGVSPLLAAWLPNLTFGLVAVILIIWRESWLNWVKRLLPLFILGSLLIFNCGVQAGDIEGSALEGNSMKIQADHLEYNQDDQLLEAVGNVRSQLSEFHIHAEKVIIKLADGTEKRADGAEEIILESGDFSGCDLEEPHYYFDASEVTIYPDDHLVARHVVFRELNGSLPLFYWPYLYISLKDKDQQLIPEFGYNQRRGWFLKTTYYYWYQNRLPGEFYLDYYTISGYGGGFKQHIFYEPDFKSWVYYYAQENRTGIPGLLNWQGAVNIEDQRGDWQTDTNLNYTDYDDYTQLKGRINIRKSGEKQHLNFNSRFESQDYFETDNNDDKKLDLDLIYRMALENDWDLNLSYNQDYLLNPEDGLKKRWGSKSYLRKRTSDLDFRVLLERYAPRFSEEDEDKVSFYRWPELNLQYTPAGPLVYQLMVGNYYEDISGIKGYRELANITYDQSWRLNNSIRLRAEQGLTGRLYQVSEVGVEDEPVEGDLPYLLSYDSGISLDTDITDNLSWNNKYSFTLPYGETPFNFDRVKTKERVDSTLRYRLLNFNFRLSGGYDIYNLEYLPLTGLLNWKITPSWEIRAGSSYNFNTETFGDLAVTSKYKDELWEINTGLKYDINNSNLKRVDNQLIYDLENQWYLELNNSFDYENNLIKKANILLKKNFHCRQLWFSYDYLDREFVVEYHLNIFPEQGIRVGTSEEEPFMFDLGIRDILGIDF